MKFYIFSFYSIIFWHLRLVSDSIPIVPVHLAYQQINQLANRERGREKNRRGGEREREEEKSEREEEKILERTAKQGFSIKDETLMISISHVGTFNLGIKA